MAVVGLAEQNLAVAAWELDFEMVVAAQRTSGPQALAEVLHIG